MASPPTLATIPIVCINLDSRPDRWEAMLRRLTSFGLTVNLTRKPACTPSLIQRHFDPRLSPGEQACAQSHLEVWESFLASNDDIILVLEDDVQFRHDFISIVNQKLATITRDDPEWHALFLNVSESLPTYENWMPAKQQWMAGATIYSRRGVQKLLQLFGPHTGYSYFSTDWMTWKLQESGHSYTYFPWLVVQDHNPSDIRDAARLQQVNDKMRGLLAVANYDYTSNYI